MFMSTPTSKRSMGLFYAAVILLMACSVRAQDSTVIDLPIEPSSGKLPLGLADWPKERAAGSLSLVEVPLLPVGTESSLLVSVFFTDREGLDIRAFWRDKSGKVTTLRNKLSEDVSGLNQSLFKVTYDLLYEGGDLLLQTSGSSQPVKRIKLSWLWPANVYMGTASQSVEYVPMPEKTIETAELMESGTIAVPDTFRAGIWKDYLQDAPTSLTTAVNFIFSVEQRPKSVAIEGKLLNVAFGVHPMISVNGNEIGYVDCEVPSLASDGYFGTEGSMSYAGWRTFRALVPAEYFKVGENSIEIAAISGAYLKESFLELKFAGPYTDRAASFLPTGTSRDGTASAEDSLLP